MQEYKITSPVGESPWNKLDGDGEKNLKDFVDAAIANSVQFTVEFRTV